MAVYTQLQYFECIINYGIKVNNIVVMGDFIISPNIALVSLRELVLSS